MSDNRNTYSLAEETMSLEKAGQFHTCVIVLQGSFAQSSCLLRFQMLQPLIPGVALK